MPKPDFPILDLEEKLEKDFEGTRTATLEQLSNLRREVKSELDKGLAPDEYAGGAAFLEAVDAATEVVEKLRK